ncbi:MAG: hypothetical protein FWE23_07420 [Chitinivibrionia bacterium]|nr:hypothetical protein [Chitinivibrionia bacterium]
MKRNLFLAVMFAVSVVWAQAIDWNADEITIRTATELRGLANRVNSGIRNGFEGVIFTLANDINLEGDEFNQWIPIGNEENRFRGIFDGNGFAVSGVFINRPEQSIQGFFGINHGTIKNLIVLDVDITGYEDIGGLTGQNNGTIENSITSGKVKGASHFVGGLSGNNWGIIRNSSSGVDVSAPNAKLVGGLSGHNANTIENSYATGNVEGYVDVGGLVGANVIESSIIRNSYATGSVQGNECAGGLVGVNRGRIDNSYATGDVSGSRFVGGLVGFDGRTIRNCYALTGTAADFIGNRATTTNSGFKTTEELKEQSTFTDWCFSTIWSIDENTNNGFPHIFLRTLLSLNSIEPIGARNHTGNPITPTIEFRGGAILTENVDYTVEYENNTDVGTATATVIGIGNYLGTVILNFEIIQANVEIVRVMWGEKRLFTYNGEPQRPTATVPNGFEIEFLGEWINEGDHTATIRLTVAPHSSFQLDLPSMPFQIHPKPLTVVWTQVEDDDFVFNRISREKLFHASAKDTILGIEIDIELSSYLDRNFNGINAGRHYLVANITDERVLERNYVLQERRHGFDILHRPINILLEADQAIGVNLILTGTEKDTIVVDTPLFADSNALKDIIWTLVDLDNFVGDDDESVFTGTPTITFEEIEETNPSPSLRSSDDLVRYRLYLLRIETEGMLAENYQIGATEFFIRTDEFLPSFIRQNTSRDNRYGIILENAVVSDFARISVITPEQATVNVAIFDNLGNVVFSADDVRAGFKSAPTADGAIVWNLQNFNGRFVANGTYLIIAEATTISGRRYLYSARIGINR